MNPDLQTLHKKIEAIDEKMRRLLQQQNQIDSSCDSRWQELDKERFSLMEVRSYLIRQQDQYPSK